MTKQEREAAAKDLAEKSSYIASQVQAEDRRTMASFEIAKAKIEKCMARLKETDPAEYERIMAKVKQSAALEDQARLAKQAENERAGAEIEKRYPHLQEAADKAANAPRMRNH